MDFSQWLEAVFNMQLPFKEILWRLGLACFCGGVIGFEREEKQKPAGLRTHMLVSLGAATFVLVAVELMLEGGPVQSTFDPVRIIQGVAQGIGFLGAGTIIQRQTDVHGLTSAALIWTAGGIGACCGAGFTGLALVVTVFAFITMTIMNYLEKRLGKDRDKSHSSTH